MIDGTFGIELTKACSQLGNVAVVPSTLLQVNESYVLDDQFITPCGMNVSNTINERSNHTHHPCLSDLHTVPPHGNRTLWNNLCTLCLLLWRTIKIDRGSSHETDLHDHPITATQYIKPIPSRRAQFVTPRTPTPCHVSRTAHDVVHFRLPFSLYRHQ